MLMDKKIKVVVPKDRTNSVDSKKIDHYLSESTALCAKSSHYP